MYAGSDYSQSSIDLARAVAERRGMDCVQWRVDDVLHTGITERCVSLPHSSPNLRALQLTDIQGVPDHASASDVPNLAEAKGNRWDWSLFSIVLWMRRYNVITDKGTFDAIGLSEGGPAQQARYISSVHSLLQSGGLFIITSCNNTLQELRQAFTSGNHLSGDTLKHQIGSRHAPTDGPRTDSQAQGSITPCSHPGAAPDTLASRNGQSANGEAEASETHFDASSSHECPPRWVYVDHVRTYRVYSFGGFEGSRVCTVAFKGA